MKKKRKKKKKKKKKIISLSSAEIAQKMVKVNRISLKIGFRGFASRKDPDQSPCDQKCTCWLRGNYFLFSWLASH